MNIKLLLKELRDGIFAYKDAIKFINDHKLYAYYLAPLVISVIFIVFSFLGISIFADWLDTLFQNWFGVQVNDTSFQFIKDFKEFFQASGKVLITILLKIIMFFLVLRLNKYFTLILLSPVLAFLSEKVDSIINEVDYPFEWGQFMKDVWRGILIALRNMFIEFSVIILVWILTFFIPILLPFTAAFLFLVSAYYYGFSMLDYSNERSRLNVKQSIRFIQLHKGATLGNGVVFQLLVSIPVLGAIYAPITAVVAATLSVNSINRSQNESIQ